MRYLSSSLVLAILLMLSCTTKEKNIEYNPAYEKPMVSFSYTGNEGSAPVNVSFINYSTTFNPDSANYLWAFGINGPQSTDKNPTHTFYNNTNSAESKQITLTVFDLMTDLSQTKSIVIMIQPAD